MKGGWEVAVVLTREGLSKKAACEGGCHVGVCRKHSPGRGNSSSKALRWEPALQQDQPAHIMGWSGGREGGREGEK